MNDSSSAVADGRRAQSGDSGSAPSPRHRLAVIVTVAATVIFAALYALVVYTYAQSSQAVSKPDLPTTDAVTVLLKPTAVRPGEREVTVDLNVIPPDSLVDSHGLLTDKLLITFLTGQSARVVAFDAGTPALGLDQVIPMGLKRGSYDEYPLDHYGTDLSITAATTSKQGTTDLSVQSAVWGDLSGWQVVTTSDTVSEPTAGKAQTVTPDAIAHVGIQVARPGSTVTIVALLLVAMIAVSALSFAVGWAVFSNKRVAEATLASFCAAALFAMVPLRVNMPGAPPIGVWLDFLVFLWVILFLMLALCLMVTGWLIHGRRPERPKAK